jgi:hypothetical protein
MSIAGLLWAGLLVAASADDVAVTSGADADAGAEIPAVAVVPLQSGTTVTTKQARGVLARLRTALEAVADEGAIKLLPATKDDDKVVRRCGQEAGCYGDTATARGADVVIYGLVEAGEGGLRLVAKTTGRAASERALLFTADDVVTDAALDRLARELVAPGSLRGALSLRGQPGDTVIVDGQRRGTIGDDGTFTLERLREGRHPVEVRRPEGHNGAFYEPFTREVVITHKETTSIKVVLLPTTSTATLGEVGDGGGPPFVAIAAVATGGALVLGGATVGIFSLLDAFTVEDRAEQQQLVFPRDEALVTRGRTLAVVANVLYGAGAVVAGAGAAWWWLAPVDDDGAATVGDGR